MSEAFVEKDENPAGDNIIQEQPTSNAKGIVWAVVILLVLVGLAAAAVFLDGQLTPRSLQIAFMSDRDENWEVYIMDEDGSNPTNLTHHPDDDGLPLYAAGKNRLAFVSNRKSAGLDIYLMDLSGNGVSKIDTISDTTSVPVAWSKDGQFLALTSNQNGPPETFLANVDGGELINLTQREGASRFEDWAPHAANRFLASAGSPTGILLFEATVDGSESKPLTDGAYPLAGAQWSPDGNKIVFMATMSEANPIDIYVMDAAGGDPINLTQSPANDIFPRWSPDGTKIAFLSDRDGNTEIYVMDADGNNPTNLTNHPAAESVQGDFWWSPDGSKILFHSNRDNDSLDVFVMNADGSNQVNLTNSPSSDFNGIWIE